LPTESFISAYLFIQKKASFLQMAVQAIAGNDAFVRKLTPSLVRALMQSAKQGTCHGRIGRVRRQLSIKIETPLAFSMSASLRQTAQETNGVR